MEIMFTMTKSLSMRERCRGVWKKSEKGGRKHRNAHCTMNMFLWVRIAYLYELSAGHVLFQFNQTFSYMFNFFVFVDSRALTVSFTYHMLHWRGEDGRGRWLPSGSAADKLFRHIAGWCCSGSCNCVCPWLIVWLTKLEFASTAMIYLFLSISAPIFDTLRILHLSL